MGDNPLRMGAWRRLRERARTLKREIYVIYLACRDPRTPWYAKAVAGVVVAYSISPLDLIPDFIPVLGFLDDAILVPLGIAVVIRLIPSDVLTECRAAALANPRRLESKTGAVVIVGVWIIAALIVARLLLDALF